MDLTPLQNQHLIVVKRPGLWLVSGLVILLVIVLSLWISFERGRIAGGYDSKQAAGRVEELEMELANLQNDMAKLQTDNTALERNNHIEKDANRQVKETIVKLQDEILKLKEEVTFYRGLVSPDKLDRRLHVQDLQFVRKSAQEFDYKIVVTQRGNNTRVVRGIMRVTIEGTQNGEVKKKKIEELISSGDKRFKLGFKYFQRFQGTVVFPDGFTPSTLRVEVVPSTSRLARVDNTVEWASVSSEGETHNVGE